MVDASALLIVQPVTTVSIPAKLYEYMAAGRPILALAEPGGETAELVDRLRGRRRRPAPTTKRRSRSARRRSFAVARAVRAGRSRRRTTVKCEQPELRAILRARWPVPHHRPSLRRHHRRRDCPVIAVRPVPSSSFEPVLERLSNESQDCFGFPQARLVPVGYEERPFSFLLRVAVWRPERDAHRPHMRSSRSSSRRIPQPGVDMRCAGHQDFESLRADPRLHVAMGRRGRGAAHRLLRRPARHRHRGSAQATRCSNVCKRRAAWFPDATRMTSLEADA